MMRAFLIASMLLAMPLAAQEEPSPSPPEEPSEPPVFSEAIDVLVVNLETVVTDREGNRVPDLTPEDFRLFVDGVEVPIDYFTEIREGMTLRSEPGEGDRSSPEVAPPDSEAAATNYLIFIDDFFAFSSHRNLVLERLEEQILLLGERDQVAIVAYDGIRATLITDWTSSRLQVLEALEKASRRKAGGANRRAEMRMFRSELAAGIDGELDGSSGPGVAGSTAFNSRFTIDAYFPMLERQITRLVDAAAASLRGSLPPPGRKVALLVSGGWASGPLMQFRDSIAEVGRSGRDLLERQDEVARAGFWYRPLVNTANLLGYTLYPVDAPGLGWGGPSVTTTTPGVGFDNPERNVEYTLKQLAQETGGRPMLNGLRSEALGRVVADTRSYYWLGFNALREGDGRHHDIHVKVVREGLRARTRQGYVDITRQEEAARVVEAGLMLGDGAEAGSLDVVLGDPRRGEKRTVEVPVVINIPFDDLEIIPIDQRRMAVVEVSLGARDKRGVVSDIMTIPVQMSLDDDPSPGSIAIYRLKAILRREKHELVITVRDAIGGGVLVRRLQFDPKKKSPATAADL